MIARQPLELNLELPHIAARRTPVCVKSPALQLFKSLSKKVAEDHLE